MARRKKKEEGGGGSPAWMATFSDLMNLLLCFFVLLFAFSSVDAEKFAEIAASFNSALSVLDGGSSAIGDGKMVSQGVSQLDYVGEYYNQMGLELGENTRDGKEDGENGTVDKDLAESGGQTEKDEQGSAGAIIKNESGETNQLTEEKIIEKYEAKKTEKEKTEAEKMYESVMEQAQEKKLQDSVSVRIDENYQYVEISLSGAILFDSGRETIKDGAIPILSKVGDILKTYKNHTIKVIGHTDNVPISNSRFQSNMWLSTARATKVFEYLTVKKNLDPSKVEASGRGEYEPVADNSTAEGRAKNRRVEIKIYNQQAE